LLIGGGIGIFPLLQLAKKIDGDTIAVLGFRTKSLISMKDDFEAVCTKLHIATDDGSFGFSGVVTDLAEQIIKEQTVGSIYSCGPIPMLKAVKALAEKYNLFCELSLEARMGCGVGACMTCVCKTAKNSYITVCKAGPVFPAKEVNFDD
jgi:dihydroorotate dehydrogenase electron transfer subunit